MRPSKDNGISLCELQALSRAAPVSSNVISIMVFAFLCFGMSGLYEVFKPKIGLGAMMVIGICAFYITYAVRYIISVFLGWTVFSSIADNYCHNTA